MLNLGITDKRVVISTKTFILAFFVSKKILKQLVILGVSVYSNQIKESILKVVFGIVAGSIFFIFDIGVVSLTGSILAIAIAANLSIGNLNCENLVSKLPSDIISSDQGVKHLSFLDSPPERVPKIIVTGSEKIEIYSPVPSESSSCTTEFLPVPEVKKPTIFSSSIKEPRKIQRKCNKEYIPLNARTKTLDDLKREDSIENREQASPSIERYRKKGQAINNERLNR